MKTEIRRLRDALEAIILEADQSNGGKGAQLPIVLYIRKLAVDALYYNAKAEEYEQISKIKFNRLRDESYPDRGSANLSSQSSPYLTQHEPVSGPDGDAGDQL